MRIEPPPSLACPSGTIPEATAAADPPLEGGAVVTNNDAMAEQMRLGSRQDAYFRCVRFPHEYQPGLLLAHDQFAVVLGHEVFRKCGPRGLPHAAVGGAEVLYNKRHARERSFGQLAFRRLAGLVIKRSDHGVEFGIQALDALDSCFNEFDGLDLFLAHQFCLGGGIEESEFIRYRHVYYSFLFPCPPHICRRTELIIGLLYQQRPGCFIFVEIDYNRNGRRKIGNPENGVSISCG